MISVPERVAVWLVAINAAAFLAFWLDKRLAENGSSQRIPERLLLWLAFLGGSVGAIVAQRWFRHKTRKEPFRSYLNGIVALQVVALAAWAIGSGLPARLGLP
jgi:uncharacterized membrane protein YsdA (DUF1294 family)